MNPIWDHLLVGIAIAAALGYFLWHGWALRGKGGSSCGGGCGCPAVSKPKIQKR